MSSKKQKKNKFDFDGLIIFEMSKNHGGSVKHGIRTVKEFSKVAKDANVRAAIKLQFQDLDTFIHPKYVENGDSRVKRYFASRLTEEQFKKIVDEIHAQGLISMSTPFDEDSVDMLDRLGVQAIKVASSASADWPLLQRIVESKKPVICSIGGLSIDDIDDLYNFFNRNGTQFAFLYCVGMYPTPLEHMNLYNIAFMKERYPNTTIGFSTHEPSDNTGPVQIAYTLGARLFEKHVIVPDEKLEDLGAQPIKGHTPVTVYGWKLH